MIVCRLVDTLGVASGERLPEVIDKKSRHPTNCTTLFGTGWMPDGRAFPPGEDRTCNNWANNDEGAAQISHSDRTSDGNMS